MKITLTDNFAFTDFQSNSHGINSLGTTYRRGGLLFDEWSTNILKRISVGASPHTMETGAKIKVWGVRA